MAQNQNLDNKTFRLEADLTKHVKKYLESLAPLGHFWKASDRYHPGVADFLGCYKGEFVAIELKAEDGEPSAHQIDFLAKIATAGGYIVLAKTLGSVKELIAEIDAKTT